MSNLAEYCLQCNFNLGNYHSDLEGVGLGVLVECYGCGWIEVNQQGECTGCLQHTMTWPDEIEEEPDLRIIQED